MTYDLTLTVDETVSGVSCPDAGTRCFANNDCAELSTYGECTQPSTPDGYEYIGKGSVTYDILITCKTCTSSKCKTTGTFRRHQSFYYNLLPTESGDGLTFTS